MAPVQAEGCPWAEAEEHLRVAEAWVWVLEDLREDPKGVAGGVVRYLRDPWAAGPQPIRQAGVRQVAS